MAKMKTKKFILTAQILAAPDVPFVAIRADVRSQLEYVVAGSVTKIRISLVSDKE
jgi:hypothetical protein